MLVRRCCLLLLFAAAVLGSGGCRKPPTIENYERQGLRFRHSSDWSVTKDAPSEKNPAVRILNVEGPDEAVLVILLMPTDSAMTLEGYASSVAARRGAAIEDRLRVGGVKLGSAARGSSEPMTASIAGKSTKGIRQHFGVTVLTQPIPHEADFFVLEQPRHKVFLMAQSSDEGVSAARVGWQQIFDTLAVD